MEKVLMNRYSYLFFDLDHTLWDYDANVLVTLREMYALFNLSEDHIQFPEFQRVFHVINDDLWYRFNHAMIDRETIRKERFRTILADLGAPNEEKAREMSFWFLEHSPRQPALIEGARELLDYLHGKYPMLILTNGFDAIQRIKMETSGIGHYFDHLITSDSLGITKPDPRIFNHALSLSGRKNHEVLMVGDNLFSDVAGSLNAGIDCVFFNPQKQSHTHQAHYEIHTLHDLRKML